MRKHNIEYLRVICTNACNLNCEGCHKEGQKAHEEIPVKILYKIISSCINAGIKKVKLIGGEPTLYSGTAVLISELSQNFPRVDLSIISNCSAKIEFYETLKKNGLNRLNISIHGWSDRFFLENTRSNKYIWELVRDNLKQLLLKGYINKINYVIKKGVNESDLYALIDWLKQFHEIRLDILNFLSLPASKVTNPYYYSMDSIEKILQARYGIKKKSVHHNPYSIDSENLLLENGLNINLKNNELKNFDYMNICENCTKKNLCTEGIAAMRLTTDMKLQPCLIRSDHCLDLKQCNVDLDQAIKNYFDEI